MNGYMFFATDRRPKLKKEKPDLPVTEVAKLMGAEWKEMDAKKQKPYVTKADKDKKRYEKELATYNMFIKEQMPKMKGTPVTEAMGELGKKWKSLSAKQQDKYKKLAEAAAAESD